MSRRVPRRIATISVHTSPLEQPGTGDAGGLNVYVVEVAKRMAARGIEVEIFTRAVSRDAPPLHELVPGVLVRHVPAGPFEELDKADLPAELCQFTLEVLGTEAAYAPGRYDLVHGHYWLSGHVARSPRSAGASRWCSRCIPWGGSRTLRWRTATCGNPKYGCVAKPTWSPRPTGWSRTPTKRRGS